VNELFLDNLKKMLLEKGVEFELIVHDQPVYSAREGSAFLGIEIGQTAPVLILETEKGYFAVIVSGERGRVDFKKIAQALGCGQAKLAKKEDVERVTGFAAGNLPLAGLALPCIVDRRLYRYPFIYGGSGKLGYTLKVSPDALKKVNQVAAELDEM